MNQIVRLAAVPGSVLKPSDFTVDALDSEPDSVLPAGYVEVRSEYIGLNAGLRSRLGSGAATTLGPSLGIGDTPKSDAVARIIRSENARFLVGERVVGLLPWQSSATVPADGLRHLDQAIPSIDALTLVGHVGATAYAALVHLGNVGPGDVVWISAAAGGVGSCAVQFARALGATVIASAGGAERTSYLRDTLGVLRIIDRTEDLEAALDHQAPQGIDVYLDLVGGDHLSAAVPRMNVGGRIVIVGRSGPKTNHSVLNDSGIIISKRLKISGLSVTDHSDAYARVTDLVNQVAKTAEPFVAAATVSKGWASVPEAFSDLLQGRVLGRSIVQTEAARNGT